MNDSHNHREPWEINEADSTEPEVVRFWTSVWFLPLVVLTIVLITSAASIQTKRSAYENDLVIVYTIARILHSQPDLNDIPMEDTAATVRTLLAGTRTSSKGFVTLNDLDDVEKVAAASLLGQKKCLQEMAGRKPWDTWTGNGKGTMSEEIMGAVLRFYGRERVSAEAAAEVLRHRGMDMTQVRAYLTEQKFNVTKEVYEYQLALTAEELRVRQELHQIPFGWISGRIRGTYRLLPELKRAG